MLFKVGGFLAYYFVWRYDGYLKGFERIGVFEEVVVLLR